MKLLITCLLLVSFSSLAQNIPYSSADPYIRLISGSENLTAKRLELSSDIDTTWDRWKERGYSFGFDPKVTPMYTTVNGILSTPYMIQVRGNAQERNRKRWGYHVFEGYARDDKSRITMLVNKHVEEGRPVAEAYYYSTVYNHSEPAYNWFKIGSDVQQHSFLFGRDKAIFYGSLRLTNALTLGSIGRDDIRESEVPGDAEREYAEDAKHVNFQALKTGGDGTIFYDKDHHILVIKLNGQWMKVSVEPLPENVKYSFE